MDTLCLPSIAKYEDTSVRAVLRLMVGYRYGHGGGRRSGTAPGPSRISGCGQVGRGEKPREAEEARPDERAARDAVAECGSLRACRDSDHSRSLSAIGLRSKSAFGQKKPSRSLAESRLRELNPDKMRDIPQRAPAERMDGHRVYRVENR